MFNNILNNFIADKISRKEPIMASIYNTVRNMSKEEFVEFVYTMYMKGQSDHRQGCDDIPWIMQRMPDTDFSVIEEIRKNL